MTQINVNKVVTYGVEVPTPEVKARKVIAYGVEALPPASLQSRKTVLYAVEMIPLYLAVEKTTVYGAEVPDNSGAATQSNNTLRPLYRSGAIPKIEFSSGTSLTTNLIETANWTVFNTTPTGSFTETVVSGKTLNLNQDFNQAVVVKTSVIKPVLESLIKANMKSKLS